jgi:NitT/TauT family transport system substrate-binding protein
VRATIINADLLQKRPQIAARFMAAYRETIDWMYSDPHAVELYAKKINSPVDIVRDTIKTFYPKEALQTDTMDDVPGILRDAVKLKFLREPLTEAQLKELIRTPAR